jgi:hypothetical protein
VIIMPQKFVLEITLGNEAMQTGTDIVRALRQVAGAIDDYTAPCSDGNIRGINGNVVGHYEVI